jgi:hypothetical protein
VEQSELPPVPKEHLEILEPLTPQQLLLCCREAHRDRCQHIRTEHPDEAAAPNRDHLIESIFEHLLEEIADPRKAAAGREFRRRSMGLHEEEVVDRREGLRSLASLMASKYWDHVTTGHVAPRGSSDEYLRGLVERVQRESA